MTRNTSSSPKPWRQFEARTSFLRVPALDWPKVKLGTKTEFRSVPGAATQLWNVTCPMPIVGYVVRTGAWDSRLLVLEATWQEILAGMSDESLAREGFPDMAHFRRYWMTRTKRRFRPLDRVHAYRVRPFEPEDEAPLASALLRRLYQEHM